MKPPSDHYTRIYSSQADAYHHLITAEDIDGNILNSLNQLYALENARVLDLGSGTGRIPLLLQPFTQHITSIDLHRGMLTQQAIQREKIGGAWPLLQADMRQLPVPANTFNIVTAGWAIGHFMSWFEPDAKTQIYQVMHEMTRVSKPGGALIILETLTTGSLTPAPPTENLAIYYNWLENEWGFTRSEIQTDYQFASAEGAASHTEFFFGSELAAKIRANNWSRLPEWTGVWHKTTPNYLPHF